MVRRVELLSDVEVRVLGSLIEKDITTPDYYPLSLNALVNACNQKNNRDPVMALNEDAVRAALESLQGQRLAGPASGADSRVTKYEHRMQEVLTSTGGKLRFCACCCCAGRRLRENCAGVPSACIALRNWRMCTRRWSG